MIIYFDNSATTTVDKDVIKSMNYFNEKYYANPSALHRFGYLVEEEIKKCNEEIAKIINCDSSEIIWTSGGSESNNLAIKGYIEAHKKIGNRILTTSIEHPSVYNVFKKYENDGFDVVYLGVDNTGHIDIEQLKQAINEKTIFVSVMYVNNEIGSVQNITEIGNAIKSINSKCAFHVDFVQGFSKYKIDVKKSKIDFLSVSSHKFNGPKGVGILYKNRDCRIDPMILGGGQQQGLRSGTLNTTGIIGTTVATKNAYENLEDSAKMLKELRDYTIDELSKINDKYGIIYFNTNKNESFAPHIVSVSFKGIRAEVMLHALEEKNIYVSAGSACSSHDKTTSSTLRSIGLNKDIAESTVRLSFGKYNKKEEVDYFIKSVDEIIPKLRLK